MILALVVLSGCAPQSTRESAGEILQEFATSLEGVSHVEEQDWHADLLDPGFYYIATVTVDRNASPDVVEQVAQDLRSWADEDPAGPRTIYHLALRFGDVVMDIPSTATSISERIAAANMAIDLPGAVRVALRGWSDYHSSHEGNQYLNISVLSDGSQPPSSFVDPLLPSIAGDNGNAVTVDQGELFDVRNPTTDMGGDRELRVATVVGRDVEALACVDAIDQNPDVVRYRANVTFQSIATTTVVIKRESDAVAAEAAIRRLPCFYALPVVTFSTDE